MTRAFEESADRLAEALGTDISWIRQHTEFGEEARRWAAENRPHGLLLRSPALEQAERWIAARPRGAPAPTDETRTYISQSRLAAARRRNILTGSLAAGLVLALALAGLAYWQRGIAVEQRAIAQQNEARAKEERDRATRNFKLAQQRRREPGVRHRPGAARRAGHERRIGAQDPGDREGNLRAARGIRAR